MKKYYALSQKSGNSIADWISTNYIFFKVALYTSILVVLSAGYVSSMKISAQALQLVNEPEIVIWYGDEQSFGQQGIPQPWVNILGNVSDPDGISSLVYTLNGGSEVSLTIGPDGRRLQSSGDFNVDLDTEDLIEGANVVVITATDNQDYQTEHTVTVNYTSTNAWSLPYDIDWQVSETEINEVSQVVDGNWEITSDGIHTVTTGYDRLVAIGEMTWDDYEIIVPVTVHDISNNNGVGLLLRWMGHTDSPVSCSQPKCGWLPLGAICWYRGNRIEIYGNNGDILASQTRSLDTETLYMFKARVETNPGVGGLYSFKVWEQGEMEPDSWDITGQESLSDPQYGSSMLISHHGDVTFGNVSISSIPISISNIQSIVNSGNTSATITWNTNVPASSQVAYGLTSAYELGPVTNATMKTAHSLDLTNLEPNTEYHYQISSISAGSDEAITGDLTFTTVTSDIVSDDFHLPLLDPLVWTFVDPVGDCDYELVGSNTEDAWLDIQVPAGVEHQLWTSGLKVPHVRQICNNADFEVEAKFESPVSTPQYQEQGILVRQDDETFLRFEFFSRTNGTYVYVASFDPGGHNTHTDIMIGSTGLAPLYMRVKRQNELWTMSYSMDGVGWTQSALFTFDMTVTTIGPYAGNAIDGSSPAHTGSIDYFFNTAAPVVPEDPVSSGVVVITSTPVTTAAAGEMYEYDVEADGIPAPTFSLLTAPSGMDINASSGLIEWTPDAPGDFNVSVQASNTTPSLDIQDFVIHVQDIPWSVVSDDFNNPGLDDAIWSFIDPLGGGGYTLTGSCSDDAWINISVPGGSDHQLWTTGIQVPHILQESNDTDFELEVKFESSVCGAYQEQGILIKEDDANFLRFEFYSTSSNTFVIAATLTAGSPSLISDIKFNDDICTTGIAPLYMRVKRSGNQWTQSYSMDGITWHNAGIFVHTLTVTSVGTYAGNFGSNPAHTSSVDYFLNIASAVSPEDAPCTVWLGTIDEDWNKNGNWSMGSPDESLSALIPDIGASENVFPEINGPANCKNLIVETGATLDIDVNGMLTIHRSFLNNGELSIHSDETGTGSFIDNGFISGSGETSVERYLSDDKWHYISSPVDDPTAEVFMGMYMMEWDEPSGEWSYITDPNYLISTDMQGFAIWTDDPGVVTFVGDLNRGAKSMNMTKTISASHNNKGFNFSGNPFPSALDWNVDDGDGWSRIVGNIDPTLYIWNGTEGNYGVYVKDAAEGTNDVDNVIPQHQGFFVHCSAAEGSISVDGGARIHGGKDILKSSDLCEDALLKLKISGNGFSDEVILQLNEQATTSYDNLYDGIKFFGNEEAPQLYSIATDECKLSINSFPFTADYKIIPLGVAVGINGQYSISVETLSGFEIIDNIQLEDLITGTITTLNQGIIYNFSATPGDESNRFNLHLLGNVAIDNHFPRLLNIYSKDKTIIVEFQHNTNGEIIIYNLMGQKISTTKVLDSQTRIKLKNSGCYLVTVIENDRAVTEKIIVR